MNESTIFLPCAALVALTAAVGIRLFVERIGDMKRNRIHPQTIAISRQAVERLRSVQAADNYRNLFEVPVLFYALSAALTASHLVSLGFVAAAWVFVGLRVAHSYIHCTYNKVVHRFAVFAVSSTLLVAMWLAFTICLVINHAA